MIEFLEQFGQKFMEQDKFLAWVDHMAYISIVVMGIWLVIGLIYVFLESFVDSTFSENVSGKFKMVVGSFTLISMNCIYIYALLFY
ncbi:hypothetical protein [Cytobacillus sp. NCCP-133]|uniref:hypothetical protein n=1 Tax=Cytobacillus sp. NCCP-133 TaxID=766848 RepID=UPI00222E34C1|nr:hypothetical protein [Cytobacillus sp. NCCP-133]GLB58686.1 hypothetical protein NCCP133_08190 [Cytobacillus sp. NCCP-133]